MMVRTNPLFPLQHARFQHLYRASGKPTREPELQHRTKHIDIVDEGTGGGERRQRARERERDRKRDRDRDRAGEREKGAT